jgi:iron complex transport system substrate-binding protein
MKLKCILPILLIAANLAACTSLRAPAPAQVGSTTGTVSQTATRPSVTPVTPTSAPIDVIDALGRQVTLPAPPQRIVITGKALIMVLDAAYVFPEAAARIAAMGNAGQSGNNFIALIDPDFKQKAILQQDAGAEQIAAAHPDLVVLKSALAESTGKALEAIGIPVIYVDFETPEQYMRDLRVLGQVFEDQARAEQVIGYYQKQVTDVQTRLEGVTEKPKTLLLYYSDQGGSASFNVPPLTWMQTLLVQMAGGEPVWASANPGKGWTKVSLEQIAAWEADDILIVSYTKNPSDVVAGLKANPEWQALRATQQGHLYAFPGDLYSWDQPDARWVLGLTWLAARLHPDRFTSLDITLQAQNFYQTLYGLDVAFFNQKILPSLRGDLR